MEKLSLRSACYAALKSLFRTGVCQATVAVGSGRTLSFVIIPFANDRVLLDGYVHQNYPQLSQLLHSAMEQVENPKVSQFGIGGVC
jgi:hypothetical protein